jgi:KDO II ethanolaminephosphotransferase
MTTSIKSPKLALYAIILWVGLFLNLPVLWRRLHTVYDKTSPILAAWGIASELLLVLSFCALVLCISALMGRWSVRVVGVSLLVISAICAYYMTVFNVVIGFGVIAAVFTTDHDMSREVVGLWFIAWSSVLGGVPALWWWCRRMPASWWREAKPMKALVQHLGWCAFAFFVFFGAQKMLDKVGNQLYASEGAASPKVTGVAAHAYVPSNWLAGAGMVVGRAWVERRAERNLIDPAKRFTYQSSTSLNDMVVVLVVGETARHDRFGLLGHDRDTTPLMAFEKNLIAFAGKSCDTITKLSLACMFVRPEGIRSGEALAPDTILERDVFSVFRHLNFRMDLFAMQSEAGFYARTGADFYKIREVIAAQPANTNKPLDDMLLVPELTQALRQHDARSASAGKRTPHLVVLHTKGSHYLYSQRYPRAFARWTPECMSVDGACSRSSMLNAFDNSILYTDYFLNAVRDTLRERRALVIYVSDHGESIDENAHFHGTPRAIAPADQRKVPLVFWASNEFLADPVLAARFGRLKTRQAEMPAEQAGHHNLFASLLGCLGINSTDGGINPDLNLCQ